jgi:hypothetical protein
MKLFFRRELSIVCQPPIIPVIPRQSPFPASEFRFGSGIELIVSLCGPESDVRHYNGQGVPAQQYVHSIIINMDLKKGFKVILRLTLALNLPVSFLQLHNPGAASAQ